MSVVDPAAPFGVTRWVWSGVPRRVDRPFPTAGLALRDGSHLTLWRLGVVAPVVSLLGGFLFGWQHVLWPMSQFDKILQGLANNPNAGIVDPATVWTSCLTFMIVAAVIGTLSAACGLYFVVGFAFSEFFLRYDRFFAPSPFVSGSRPYKFIPTVLAVRVPLLATYVLLGVLVVSIPLAAKALAYQFVTVPGLSRRARAGIGVILHPLVSVGLVWAFAQVAPLLVRPLFTWIGQAPPINAIAPLQQHVWPLLLAVFIAAFVRVAHQIHAANNERLTAQLDSLRSPPLDQPSLSIVRRSIRVLLRSLVAAVLLAGFLNNATEFGILFAIVAVVGLARAGIIPVPLGPWPGWMARVPLIVRIIVGLFIARWLAAQFLPPNGGLGNTFLPFLKTTIATLVVFTLLNPPPPSRPSPPDGLANQPWGAPTGPPALPPPDSQTSRARLGKLAVAVTIVVAIITGPAVAFADNCGSPGDCYSSSRAILAALFGLVTLVGIFVAPEIFIPLIAAKGITEAITGRDLITQRELSWNERILDVALSVAPYALELREATLEARAMQAAAEEAAALRQAQIEAETAQALKAETEGQAAVQATEAAGTAAGESGVFRNVHPKDVPGAFQRVAPDVAAARSGRYVYVVTEDGTLVIGRAGRAGHIDLANGESVRAAGEFTTKGGEVVSVNNASGHYLPNGASAQQAALDAMRARGLKVTGPYTEVGG